MSIMVDPRPQPVKADPFRRGEGGPLIWLVRARFVLTGVVIAAGLWLGVAGRGLDGSSGRPTAKLPDLRLDPNTAPREVLAALPHVGSALVDRWVRAREERPFRSLEDARTRVSGLGPATLDQIAPYFDFPDGRGLDPGRVASSKRVRSTARTRVVSRKKTALPKAVAPQPTRLAARTSRSLDL